MRHPALRLHWSEALASGMSRYSAGSVERIPGWGWWIEAMQTRIASLVANGGFNEARVEQRPLFAANLAVVRDGVRPG